MRVDGNLIGIVLSSLSISLCIFLSIHTVQGVVPKPCVDFPHLVDNTNRTYFIRTIIRKMGEAKKRIVVATTRADPYMFEARILNALSIAHRNGAYISFIFCSESYVTDSLKNAGFLNITIAPIASNFLIVDEFAIFLCSPFDYILDQNENHTCLTFSDCITAVDDLMGFYDYQWRLANNLQTNVQRLKQRALTSLINPVRINDTFDTFYFFHNSPHVGETLRISTSDFLPSIILNSPYPVSIFLDDIPSLIDDQNEYDMSFFIIFKRFLSSQKHTIRYLIPSNTTTVPKQWLDTTAAFSKARIRLYDQKSSMTNFLIIGNRTFVFSHKLKGKSVTLDTAIHFSSNSSVFSNDLRNYFDYVWSISKPYYFQK